MSENKFLFRIRIVKMNITIFKNYIKVGNTMENTIKSVSLNPYKIIITYQYLEIKI